MEKFFGKQRQRGRVNENPTVDQALKNNQALRVISSIDLDIIKGNTRGSNSSIIVAQDENCEPLSKRRRKQKSGGMQWYLLQTHINCF